MTAPSNFTASNGVGVITDDQLNTLVQVDPTAAYLRGFIGTTNQAVSLLGITAPGDGLAGTFYWSFGSSYVDDNLNTIVPSGAAGAGAWLRATVASPATVAIPAGTTTELLGATGTAGVAGLVALGANLSITGGTLNATGGGSASIPAGTTSDLLGATGTAGVAGLVTLGSNLSLTGEVLGVVASPVFQTGTVTFGSPGTTGGATETYSSGALNYVATAPLGGTFAWTVAGDGYTVGGAMILGQADGSPPTLTIAVETDLLASLYAQDIYVSSINGMVIGSNTGTLDLANSSKLATVGAFTTTLTTTGATNVTLPTSGTLITTAAIPASDTLHLLGATGAAGLAGAITVGTNLSLTGGTLSATGSSGVSSIVAGTGLSGGTITATGTIALANTAVTAGSYTLGAFTVNAEGQLTAASSTSSTGTGNVVLAQSPTLSPATSAGVGLKIIATAGQTANLFTVENSGLGIVFNLGTSGIVNVGTWNGSLIGGTYGGTGVNNGVSTLTYGGNVTFSGAFTSSFTLTAATNLTLPTTGTVTALGNASTGTGSVVLSNGPTLTAVTTNASVTGSATTGAYNYGALGFSDTNNLVVLSDSVNSYAQEIIQNTNSGAAASADLIVANNLATASTYYGDFGINSSSFSGTGSMSLPNATYLYAASGDLSIGTMTSNAVHFVANNAATDAATISAANTLTVASGATLNTPAQLVLTNATGLPLSGHSAIAASTLVGNPGTASASPTTITVGSGLTLSAAGTLTASGGGGGVTADAVTIINNSGTISAPGAYQTRFPTKTGRYYTANAPQQNNQNNNGQTLYVPVYLPTAGTITSLSIRFGATINASGMVLGVYADDGTGSVGAKLGQASTTLSSANANSTVSLSVSISIPTPGIYWIAQCINGGASNMWVYSNGGYNQQINSMATMTGSGSIYAALYRNTFGYYSTDTSTTTLPATPTGLALNEVNSTSSNPNYIPGVVVVGF